jgi:hypothetical protein
MQQHEECDSDAPSTKNTHAYKIRAARIAMCALGAVYLTMSQNRMHVIYNTYTPCCHVVILYARAATLWEALQDATPDPNCQADLHRWIHAEVHCWKRSMIHLHLLRPDTSRVILKRRYMGLAELDLLGTNTQVEKTFFLQQGYRINRHGTNIWRHCS